MLFRSYRESVDWVLAKQRQNENLRLAGLEEMDDLREVLQEAALCVVQSGNETARVTMLKNRFQDTLNPVANLLKAAQTTTGQSDDKALNNLLTTFYLKPKEGERGSVEFAHKSFGEYLFAERLIRALEDWTKMNRRHRPVMGDSVVYEQIYDLLGYGGLSGEIVGYLFELLSESDIDSVQLFERLHSFYQRWHDSEFLNQGPLDDLPQQENLPLKKMQQLRNQGIPIGLKQVDVFAGLNILILLFKLHAQAQSDSYPHIPAAAMAPAITFHPCGSPNPETFDANRLLALIHYADSLGVGTFTRTVGPHLARANLNRANLNRANLNRADLALAHLVRAALNRANLVRADLNRANLVSANLVSADLNRANLYSSNLTRTYLARADLNRANLNRVNLNSADLYSANLDLADLYSADLARANLARANLNRTHLGRVNLAHAILLNTNLSSAQNLAPEQLEGEFPPLLCGTTLPTDIAIDPNRDYRKLPRVLADRYPNDFKTVAAAAEYVQQQIPPAQG